MTVAFADILDRSRRAKPFRASAGIICALFACSVDERSFGSGVGGRAGNPASPADPPGMPISAGAGGDTSQPDELGSTIGRTEPSEAAPADPCAARPCVSENDASVSGADDGGPPSTPSAPDAEVPCAPGDVGHGTAYCIDGRWVEPPERMVAVAQGPFSMGCNTAVDTSCGDDEYPYHTVWLDTFAIDRTEVRRADYAACVTAGVCQNLLATDDAGNPCNDDGLGTVFTGEHPVLCVSWFQADAYCRWLGKRLPTEAEWEKAARGDDGRIYPWGNEPPTCTRVVMSGCRSDGLSGGPEPVGSKPAGASPYGALDMAGNAFEWVADWYEPSYYLRSPERNPAGPEMGTRKITRSSASNYLGAALRAAYRGPDYEVPTPENRHVTVGFRCARTP